MSYIGFKQELPLVEARDKPSKVLPMIIAKAKTKIYMGKGISFYCEDKTVMKKWQEFAELNNIYDFINNQQKTKSISGVAIVSINKLKGGKVILNNITPYVGPTLISYCFSTPDMVCIVEQIYLNDRPIYMRSVYDKKRVVRRFWTSKTNSSQETKYFQPFLDSNKLKMENLGIELGTYHEDKDCWIYEHKLGFIPVEVMTNLPFRPYFPIYNTTIYINPPSPESYMGINFSEVADCANVDWLMKQLDGIYLNRNVCIRLSKPSAIIVASSDTQARELASRKYLSSDIEHSVLYSAGANKVQIQTITPTTNLEQLDKAFDETLEKIYKFVGLAYKNNNATQKTSMESFTTYQGDIEMVNFMKNYDTEQWKRVIVKVFKTMGINLENKKWYFKTNENMVASLKEMLDNDIKLYQIKAKTQQQILQDIEGYNPEEAKTIIEENKKWFKENKELLESPMNSAVSGVKSMSITNKKTKANE